MSEYRLLQRHKLNKEWREVGDVVDINDELGRWWAEQGIAVRVKPLTPAPKSAPKVSAAVPEIGTPRAFVPQPSRFKCCGWK